MKLTEREIRTLRMVVNTPGGMYFGLSSAHPREARATEAAIVRLVNLGFLAKVGMKTIATDAGRAFVASIPTD